MAKNTPAAEAFRENLRALLLSRGMTMTELADLAGTSRAGISRILSGDDGVTLSRAERIANKLNVSLTDLLAQPEKIRQLA